jgi:hypothetical protein
MQLNKQWMPISLDARIILAAGLLCASQGASAAAFDVGIDDLNVRWDNTLRYNYAQRIDSQDSALLGNPNIDDGDRNFDKGNVSNRLDLLSELDLVWHRNYGLHLSGAAWYDYAYQRPLDNTSVATSNHLENGRPAIGLSGVTKRYFRGPSGELLDAFAFAHFDIDGVPLNLKAGQHTVFWGESLLLGGAVNSVSYAQSPLDLAKGLAVPGAGAQELFRPLPSISAQIQATSHLSVSAQYFLDWQAFRLPEAGSYLGFNDALLEGGESIIAANGARLVHGADIEPGHHNEWALSARWSPEFLDGTLGFYVRNFSDKLPQVLLQPAVAAYGGALTTNSCQALGFTALPTACYIDPAAASPQDLQQGRIGQYHLAYADNIHLYGLSLSKQIGNLSLGAEVSYRQNMPLISDPVNILPAPLAASSPGAVSALPGRGETGGARGDTWHGLINLTGVATARPVFDTATWIAELTWNRWDKVTQNEAVFKGRSGYTAIDAVDKDAVSLAINFTPTWFQVLPTVNLLFPISYSRGLYGNSAVTLGGSKNGGTYSFGPALDINERYRVDLKYTDFFGDYTRAANGAANVVNGATAALKDRGFISLTFKTTF